MSLRDDLIPIVDDLRREVVDVTAGLRLDDVLVRTRVWSSGQVGRGSYTDTDFVLDPRPAVREPEPRKDGAEPGKFEMGDRVIERISLQHTRTELGDGPVSAGCEVFWLVNNEAYRLVSLDEQFLQWKAVVRRMRDRRA